SSDVCSSDLAEPLPEGLLRRAVDARAGALRLLPALEEGSQLLARGAPLHLARVGRGDLLRCLDDRGAGRDGLCLRRGAGRLEGGAPLGRAAAQRLDAGAQAVQVADSGRLRRLLAELLERLVDLAHRQVGALQTGLEQADLRREVQVPAHVQRQGLRRADAGELADDALARRLTDV